jgi:hypothetical protein
MNFEEADADVESSESNDGYHAPNRESEFSPDDIDNKETNTQSTEPESDPLPENPTTIDWESILSQSPPLAEHALRYAAKTDAPPIESSRPPAIRPLSSSGGSPPNKHGISFELSGQTQKTEEAIRRVINNEFDEKVPKSFARDAMIRVAANHPEEVVGMVAAFGFDLSYD